MSEEAKRKLDRFLFKARMNRRGANQSRGLAELIPSCRQLESEEWKRELGLDPTQPQHYTKLPRCLSIVQNTNRR